MKKILYITSGYLPYTFSENLCNAKLVYALQQKGWQIDVITKVDEGPTYSATWQEPWLELRSRCHEISYPLGSKLSRTFDLLYSTMIMGYPLTGIRWARRAYQKAEELIKQNDYDAVFTRSPDDIPHIVGYKLKRKYGIPWVANWNDPSATIWPKPYKSYIPPKVEKMLNKYTIACLKNADINTFPSQSLLDHFTKFFPFLTSSQTQVIPHIALSENLYKSRTRVNKDKLYMCHSGNLSTERDPELLFKAMRKLIDLGRDKIQLDIMGQSNAFVQELVDIYQLKDYVKFLNGYPYMEAVHKLLDYDVLVLLEAKLEFGIFFASKFTDYAQASRTILAVSPQNGFAKDILTRNGGGVVVNNEDENDIFVGLNHLYELWTKNQLDQAYSSEKLLAQFSSSRVVSLYESLKF